MARRRFFVETVEDGRAVVRGEQAHHLYHVLRVKPDQVFELSDRRRLYLGRVTAAQSSVIEFAVDQELPAGPALPKVTLLAAVFKFDRLEWMVEKATELGVERIVPVVAARTELALARAAARRVERWRRIAFEAAQQSRRLAPPEIAEVTPFDRAVRETAPGGGRWMLDETRGGAESRERLTPGSGAALLVGPEGGWTDKERTMALESGFVPVGLGPLILRAETAAIAALAVLLYAKPDPADLQ